MQKPSFLKPSARSPVQATGEEGRMAQPADKKPLQSSFDVSVMGQVRWHAMPPGPYGWLRRLSVSFEAGSVDACRAEGR